SGPTDALYVVNNTMVNDRVRGRWVARALQPSVFVRVWGAPSRVQVVNNLFVGPGRALRGPGEQSHNLHSSDPRLVDRRAFDYRLRGGQPAAGAGPDPGSLNGSSLSPVAQYVSPAAEEPRPRLGVIDVGAYGRSEAGRRASGA